MLVQVVFLLLLPGIYERNAGAVYPAKGKLCLAIANPDIRSRTVVTIILPGKPQRVVEARVEGRGCPETRAEGSLYRIDAPKRSEVTYGIGLLERPMITGAGDIVLANLDNDDRTETFRGCTSQEGIHLTIWTGSVRRWHAYVSLGYDVESSCRPEEIR
jgi:hypothetical protein